MGYTNVIGYIAKMQRIYLICAIVVYRDTAYLCKEHGLRETRLEQVGYDRVEILSLFRSVSKSYIVSHL